MNNMSLLVNNKYKTNDFNIKVRNAFSGEFFA